MKFEMLILKNNLNDLFFSLAKCDDPNSVNSIFSWSLR